jgi:hypothetical protein
MNLQSFVASPFWLTNFKRRHHITSRKVTKFVMRNYVEDRQKVINEENMFLRKAESAIAQFNPTHVLNADQRTRTLSFADEKITLISMKHSMMIFNATFCRYHPKQRPISNCVLNTSLDNGHIFIRSALIV